MRKPVGEIAFDGSVKGLQTIMFTEERQVLSVAYGIPTFGDAPLPMNGIQ